MSERSALTRKALFADACLLSAGAFAVTTAIGAGIVQLLLRGTPDPIVEVIVGPGGMLATLLFGGIGAWLLHGHRMDGRAMLGMFLGLVTAVACGVALGALLPAIMMGVVRRFAGEQGELAGLFIVVGVAGAAFLAMIATQAVAALRDLRSSAPEHARLDRYRLVCAALVVLLAVVIGVLMVLDPKSEIGEALPFGIVFALAGGFIAAGADVITRGWKGRSPDGETKAMPLGESPEAHASGS